MTRTPLCLGKALLLLEKNDGSALKENKNFTRCHKEIQAHLSVSVTVSVTVSLSPLCTDNLNNALGAIRVLGLELIEDELRPHLNTVLINIRERSESTSALTVLCENRSPFGIWQQFAAIRPPTLNRSQCVTALVLTVSV